MMMGHGIARGRALLVEISAPDPIHMAAVLRRTFDMRGLVSKVAYWWRIPWIRERLRSPVMSWNCWSPGSYAPLRWVMRRWQHHMSIMIRESEIWSDFEIDWSLVVDRSSTRWIDTPQWTAITPSIDIPWIGITTTWSVLTT